jgi:hypothetical protein
MHWSDWVLVALFTLSALSSVYMIGKPCTPTTNGAAIVAVCSMCCSSP